LLEGNEGSDTLFGDDGNDLLFGEADGTSTPNDGDDYLDGGSGNDTIRDDHGNDTLVGGFGDDFMVAGIGNDVLYGDIDPTAVAAWPLGNYGRDTMYGDRDQPLATDDLGLGNGSDYIEGGSNSDTIYGGAGDDRYHWGQFARARGVPQYTCGGRRLHHTARMATNLIAGDNATIGIVGDVTSSKTITTFADGGAGADRVRAGAGRDWIFGGGDGGFPVWR